MKGMVFTEFLEMVENQFSLEMADQIIEASDLASGGAYTAIGTYDHEEMVQMVVQLSKHTGISVPDLLKHFGEYLFERLAASHQPVMAGTHDAFGFLKQLEDHIHVEVKKLYPDAELPHMEMADTPKDTLDMTYSSARPFADFAHGLLLGCIAYFDEDIAVERLDLAPDGHQARFLLTKRTTTGE